MTLVMTEKEILGSYANAISKKEQVKILAELNNVRPKTMAEWLVEHGEEVDKRYLMPRARWQKKEEPLPADPEIDQAQEAKQDKGKPRLTLVPMRILWCIAYVREYGLTKYKDKDNWKQVEPERLREALLRHILKYIDDPDGVDEESGLKHLWHIACNVAFLCAMEGEK